MFVFYSQLLRVHLVFCLVEISGQIPCASTAAALLKYGSIIFHKITNKNN